MGFSIKKFLKKATFLGKKNDSIFYKKKSILETMMKKNLMTPALKELFGLLDGQVYFVGGAVRDVLMARSVHDIDLTTPLTPAQVQDYLKNTDIHIHPTGIEHGTLTLVLSDKKTVEITSFRCDVETNGRRAKVAFGKDIRQDAFRRDFTINALYMDANGQILDFVGGLKDLKKRRLRFIGEPEKRIKEDALRILRYFRFYAQLDIKKADLSAIKACRQGRSLLDVLSKERIRDEVFKLLATKNPQKALHFMARTGVLRKIVGQYDLSKLKFLLKKEKQAGFQTDSLFRLWILCGGNLPDWPLTKNQKKQISLWNAGINMTFKNKRDYCEILYKLGKEAFLNLILLKKEKMSFTAFQFYNSLEVPILPFNAKDVAKIFHVEGNKIGEKMKFCEDIWLKIGCPIKKEVVFKKILG